MDYTKNEEEQNLFEDSTGVYETGFIKIHRKITEWEWFTDYKVCHLFIYLLLKANWKEKKWMGITINRGQLATGIFSLAEGSGLTVRETRTALSKLKETKEILIKTTNRFSIITICNYETYQVKKD